MNRAFQGLTEKGIWEQFEWDKTVEPTPQNTGYKEVEEIIN